MKLYHASRVPNLKVLKPFTHKAVDNEKVVFASDNMIFALAMTYGSGDVIAVSYGNNQKLYIDELKENSLDLLNKSGYLYILDNKDFKKDPRLYEDEYISYNEVEVLEEIYIDNVLDKLKELGAILVKYENVLDSMKKRGKFPKNPKIHHKENRFGEIKY